MSNYDYLGTGCEDGVVIMGPNTGHGAIPLGADKAENGLVGITAGTGKLYYVAESLAGDTGIQGNTGIQGLVGQTGIRGTTGIQGLVGGTGIQGLVGGTGIQGLVGGTGIQGLGITNELGSTSGYDSTGGVYALIAGHTGVCLYYYTA